ncbi:hypothetical protein ACSFBX_34780 [Variovorax sp. RB2P76]|uniref:hypothetical protein n=1 Tax=Variovorax sp. RB2P76 TaxID=3443736 RepID=UPI003F466605
MDDWGQFVWTVAASSAGTTAVLGAAAWLFKSQISHWLNKDLEAAKAQHQRDLEAYKVSLIAATERSKAAQELKKSAALRVIEVKFSTYIALYQATLGLYADTMTHAESAVDQKTIEHCNRLRGRRDVLRDAVFQASVFLDPAQYRLLTEYRGFMMKALQYCIPGCEPPNDDGALDEQFRNTEIKVDKMIRELVDGMQSLD